MRACGFAVSAGEMVERPVAVVKEPIENCLDARARRIELEVMQGGAHSGSRRWRCMQGDESGA